MTTKKDYEIEVTTIDKLVPDSNNANKGTEYGGFLLEKSLEENGLGRGICADKNGVVLAGNQILQKASEKGFTKVVKIKTKGDVLVVTQRDDILADSEEGVRLALADNATGQADLEWNQDVLAQYKEQWGVDAEDWGVEMNDYNITPEDETSQHIDYMTFCGHRIPLTEDEKIMLEQRYKEYTENNNTEYGFALSLLNNGND